MKGLVLVTAVLALLAGGAIVQWGRLHPLPSAEPTWGIAVTFGALDASMELVVVEDFLCPSCREFHEKIFPKLQEHYIATGQLRYTLVPIPILRGAGTLENAALAVYQQSPDLFLPYLEQILQKFPRPIAREVMEKALLESAHAWESIDMPLLQQCIRTRCNRDLLQKNLDWARQRMGLRYILPSFYLNGRWITAAQIEELFP